MTEPGRNRVFFPQDTLDLLIGAGRIDLEGDVLVLNDQGLRYQVEEAVRIVQEVTTGKDPFRLCGTVKLRRTLCDELGAELLGDSMLIEESAYDVVAGMIGTPVDHVDREAVGRERRILAELQEVASGQ